MTDIKFPCLVKNCLLTFSCLTSAGALETSFAPTPNSTFFNTPECVAVPADGKILVDGNFSNAGGVAQNSFVFLPDNTFASQSPSVTGKTQIEWLRGSTASKMEQATFKTWNGSASIVQVTAMRLAGGWRKSRLAIAAVGGRYVGSAGLIEQSTTFETAFPDIVVEEPAGTELVDGLGTTPFGYAAVGVAKPLVFIVRNSGSASLTDLAVTKDGIESADYSISALGMTTLEPGASTTFTVTLTPADFGLRHAAIHIGSNDIDEMPFDIHLSGEGVSLQQSWRNTYFGTIDSTGNAADGYDFDKDGLVNLVEYAFGLNPLLGSSAQLPQGQIVGSAFLLSFATPSGVSGIGYEAEWSSTLASMDWAPIPDTGAPPQHAFSVPISTNSKIFIRLRITGPTPNVYVDSVAGYDGNSGLSAAAPKATLAAALAIAPPSGAVIGLKTGGLWRESLNISSLTRPTVTRYGNGATAPVIDGANVFDVGWTKTSGFTNVYQVSVAHDATSTNRLTVYENGTLLKRVTSNAACDAATGSFVDVKGSNGTPVVVKIHATGADKNPLTNGKLYEITVRTLALFGPDNCTLIGIKTQRCCNNNGSTDLVNKLNCDVRRVLAHHGTKHNLGIGSGFVKDCIAMYSDEVTSYEPSNTTGVSFVVDGTGRTFSWERFGVVNAKGVHFLSHGAPNGFSSGSLTQSWVVNTSFVGSGVTANVGCFYKSTTVVPQVNESMCMAYGQTGSTSVTGSLSDSVYKSEGRNFTEYFRVNGGTLQNCGLAMTETIGTWFSNGSTSLPLMVNKTIFFGGYNMVSFPAGATGTYTGNYNVFYSPSGPLYFNKGSGLIAGLSNWQTATGQDGQSVYLNASDQTIGNPLAFWLGRRLSLNRGGIDGDFRINPGARVYNSAGTAFIGTFPDGTAITTAGPRTHWDWNARSSVSGPPYRWPDVPDDLTEAEEYVADPEAWNFYR